MARRPFSFAVRSEGGPVLGGSATELRIYDDAALTTLSTIYAAETGAGTIPNPRIPNAGRQTALLADRASGDAYVTVVDITGFNVGDLIPIYNGTVTAYRVITVITAGTRRFDLAAPLGTAFLASNTVVGNLDMKGHVGGWLDDARDYYMQAKNVASGRVLAPVGIPVRVPATVITTQEEGATVGTRATINYVGAAVTATDDAANARTNVTISSPTGAAFDDHSARHEAGGLDALAIDAAAGTGSLRTLGTGALQAAAGNHTTALPYAEAALGANVSIPTAGTFVDGPSVSLGAGTWLVTASVLVRMETSTDGPVDIIAKLWDGTTVEASAEFEALACGSASAQLALAGIIVLGSTTTIKVSATVGGTAWGAGTLYAATPDSGSGNHASHIRAVRLAP